MALDPKTPGVFTWNELMTTDVAAAAAFYGALFGWTCDGMSMAGSSYVTAKVRGEDAAGIMGMPPGKEHLSPGWGAYVTVASIDETLTRVAQLGGKVLVGKTPIPGGHHFAVLLDPQGAALGVFEYSA